MGLSTRCLGQGSQLVLPRLTSAAQLHSEVGLCAPPAALVMVPMVSGSETLPVWLLTANTLCRAEGGGCVPHSV